MAKKHFTVLENNPEVMNFLARRLGLSDALAFYDVYSLDADGVAHIPRPAHALLAIIPLTPAWEAERRAEDAARPAYVGPPAQAAAAAAAAADASSNAENKATEPVLWFPQTIGDACGSIGLIHCALNGAVRDFVQPGTLLAHLSSAAPPLDAAARAQLLYDSAALEEAHQTAAPLGDTDPALYYDRDHSAGQHFVAFVRGADGHLWELEGARTGPLDRGALADGEDVLGAHALALGLGRVVALGAQSAGGAQDLRFSCLALASASASASALESEED